MASARSGHNFCNSTGGRHKKPRDRTAAGRFGNTGNASPQWSPHESARPNPWSLFKIVASAGKARRKQARTRSLRAVNEQYSFHSPFGPH